MTAIATEALKFNFAELLHKEIINTTDSNHFYVGIGKSDQYDSASDNTVDPVRVKRDEQEARYNLESIIKVSETAMTFSIPRNNWISGTIYSAYNDNQVGYPTQPYYVITEDQQIYICLANNRNTSGVAQPSTIKPSFATEGVGNHQAFKTADGYIWKYLYELSVVKVAAFLSSNFMPVGVFDSSTASGAAEQDQAKIRKTAVPGQIIGVEVVDPGAGYSSTPTLNFIGNGTGAAGTVTLNGTTVGKIDMNCVISDSGFGSGYDFARAQLSGGGTPSKPAVLRPILGPTKGFGFDARKDLKSSSLMFNAKPAGAQNNNFSITTTGTFGGQSDFRQITLFKNIDYIDSATAGNRVQVTDARANRIVTLTTKPAFVKDEKITGQTSGTVAHIDHIDSTGGGALQIHYHFNHRSDFRHGTFSGSEVLQGNTSGVFGTVDSDSQPKIANLGAINRFSGDVLYIDNRSRIIRSASQTEDIKIVLTI